MSWISDNDDMEAHWEEDCNFYDPGGNSALRAGTRNRTCPTCKTPNCLTTEDINRGYQCDSCADALERGY